MRKKLAVLINCLFPVLNLMIFPFFLLLERVGFSERIGGLRIRLGRVVCIEVIPEGTERVRLVERGGGVPVEGIVELRQAIHSAYAGPEAPQNPIMIYSMGFATERHCSAVETKARVSVHGCKVAVVRTAIPTGKQHIATSHVTFVLKASMRF